MPYNTAESDGYEVTYPKPSKTREDIPGAYIMVSDTEYGEHIEVGPAMPWTPSAANAQLTERNLI